VKGSVDTARTLYLELAAIGCDLSTGEIGEPAITSLADIGRAERLLVRVRVHREELSALISGQGDKDLDAIREEGRADAG
jgi:hypothetical protein